MAFVRQTYTNDGGGKGVASTPTARAGYGDYNSVKALAKSIPIVKKPTATLRQEYVNSQPKTVYVNTSDSSDSGSGGGGQYVSGAYHSNADDVINQIKALLSEQYEKAKASYQEMYNNANRQSEQAFENDRNQINRNYVRGNRYLRSLYGDRDEGYSQLNANNSKWQSMLASAREDKSTRDSNNTAQYNSNLANTANTLAQGWYNYILPFKVQDAQQARDYDFRKYMASML